MSEGDSGSWPPWLLSSTTTPYTIEDGVKTYYCEDGSEISFPTSWPSPRVDRYGWRPIDIPESLDELEDWDSALAQEPNAQGSYNTLQNAYGRVLYPIFLPFSAQKIDRVEVLRLVQYYLAERPQTSQSFKLRHIGEVAKHLIDKYDLGIDKRRLTSRAQGTDGSDMCGANHNLIPTEHLLVHESYPLDRAVGDQCFANPSYMHHSALSDASPEFYGAWLRKYAGLAADYRALTNHFGVPRTTLKDIAAREGVDYRFLKTVGKHKLARTWKTILDWRPDLTQAELATAFNTTARAIRHHLQLADSFHPPVDPTSSDKRLSGQ